MEEKRQGAMEERTLLPKREATKEKVGLWLDTALAEEIRIVAVRQHRRLNATVEDAIRIYLEKLKE